MEDTLKITFDDAADEVILRRQDADNPEVVISTFVLRRKEFDVFFESVLNVRDYAEKAMTVLEHKGYARVSHAPFHNPNSHD